MLKLLTAPVTNERSPRYMERARAAIHQANSHGELVTLIYAATEGRVALFLHFPDHAEELVTSRIAANYPNYGQNRYIVTHPMGGDGIEIEGWK